MTKGRHIRTLDRSYLAEMASIPLCQKFFDPLVQKFTAVWGWNQLLVSKVEGKSFKFQVYRIRWRSAKNINYCHKSPEMPRPGFCGSFQWLIPASSSYYWMIWADLLGFCTQFGTSCSFVQDIWIISPRTSQLIHIWDKGQNDIHYTSLLLVLSLFVKYYSKTEK